MDPHGDEGARGAEGADVSAYRTLPVAPPDYPPATAPADIEAWKARKTYPSMLFAGGPVFGVARERAEGGWELQPFFAGLTPQDARDDLGSLLRTLARAAADEGDPAAEAEYLSAARRTDAGTPDEMAVRGERYRVVRAERFIRMGPDGPEPPRATDPDPGGPGDPEAHTDPADGLIVALDAAAPSGAVLTAELLAAVSKNGVVPSAVADDSRTAVRTHPGGVLLPATFMTAEREGGSWRPDSAGIATTPQAARDDLATHLRVMVPWRKDLSPQESEVYQHAADRLDADRCDELDVAGRHFRIIRVERLLRLGPDGPEGPRPSDTADPPAYPDPEDAPSPDPEEPMRRFVALFEKDRRRREELRGR
jgi:hypothetical protein